MIALNPSIDVEWHVAALLPDEKNNIESERRWAGGKGINVARWLKHFGHSPTLLLPLGGATGREIAMHLKGESLAFNAVPIRQSTRTNIIVSPSAGRQLRLNPRGPTFSRAEWSRFFMAAQHALSNASCLFLSGSLPRGAPIGTYAALARLAHRKGVKVFLDCDGAALSQAVKTRPFFVKPNQAELAACLGRALPSLADCRAAALALSKITRAWVLASLGARGGFLVHAEQGVCWKANAPKVAVRNTVGAGDALFAATALQVLADQPPEAWLRWGIAAGTACTERPPGELPSPRRIAALSRKLRVFKCKP